MASDKTQLKLALIGLIVSGVTALTTVGIKLLDVMYTEDNAAAITTNAPGTNAAGTNAAADPKMKVPGNTGHWEKSPPPARASGTIPFPIWAVVLILCGLTAVASMLYTKWAMNRIKLKKLSEPA